MFRSLLVFGWALLFGACVLFFDDSLPVPSAPDSPVDTLDSDAGPVDAPVETGDTTATEDPGDPVTEPVDSDGDGLTDEEEAELGTNPIRADTDDDGLTDREEIEYGTDPVRSDSDGDGLPDGWELDNGLHPLLPDADLDPDEDGLTNAEEYEHGTEPHNPDSDDDDFIDGDEVRFGSNPTGVDISMTLLSDTFTYATIDEAVVAGWTIEYAESYTPGHVTWTIEDEILSSTVDASEGNVGYSYFTYESLDVSHRRLIITFEMRFDDEVRWGGFRYRGIHIDINPSRVGIRDNTYTYIAGIDGDTVHQVRILVSPASDTNEWVRLDLFIDEQAILSAEPIELTDPFPKTSVSLASNYVSGDNGGTLGFDDLVIQQLPP